MADRTDDFNRTDTATALGTPSDGGGAWAATAAPSIWGIHSNAAYLVADAGDQQNHAWLETSVTEGTTQVTLSQRGAAIDGGILVRLADNSNFLMFQFDLLNTRYYKRVAGTFTQLGSAGSGGIATNDVASVVVSGNVITGKINGVTQGSPPTESTGSGNTKVGMRLYGPISGTGTSAAKFDNFSFVAPSTTLPSHYYPGLSQPLARTIEVIPY